MVTKYAQSVLPTKAEITQLISALTAEVPNFELPDLPTFPKPFFGGINSPELSTDHWIQEFCANASVNVIGFIIDKIKSIAQSFLGVTFDIPFPNFPGVNFSLGDIIDKNTTKISVAIKSYAASLPSPFSNITSPDIAAWHFLQNLVVEGIKSIISTITSSLSPIISAISAIELSITAPTIPTFPTSFSISIPTTNKIIAPSINNPKAITGAMIEALADMIQPLIQFMEDLAALASVPLLMPHLGVSTETGLSIHFGEVDSNNNAI